MGKIGPKFPHLLTVRAEGAEPTPLMVSLTVKRPFFFDDSPKIVYKKASPNVISQVLLAEHDYWDSDDPVRIFCHCHCFRDLKKAKGIEEIKISCF